VKNYKSVADFFNRQKQFKKNLTLRGDFCVMGKPRQTSQMLHTTRCGTTAHLIVRTRARDLTDRPNNNKKIVIDLSESKVKMYFILLHYE
jgi:hypothetical protein